jgi:hypothetical protein
MALSAGEKMFGMPKRVVYNGVEMIEGWPERIEEAQKLLNYSIEGVLYPRVPYGAENDDWDADRVPCHDCRASRANCTCLRATLSSAPPAEGKPSDATATMMTTSSGMRPWTCTPGRISASGPPPSSTAR